MDQFLSLYGGCLLNAPLTKLSAWKHSDHGLPGKLFDGSAQCHLLYGKGWNHYTGLVRGKKVSTCTALWCRNTIYLRSPNAAALQGTSCDKGRHCKGGECVLKEEKRPAAKSSTEKITDATTTGAKRPASNSQVFFPTESMTICKFFRQFGIKLEFCP